MATVSDKQALISNPVYYELQPYSSELIPGKSVILYANRFSGLDTTRMPKELEELFADTQLSLTNINLRRQLQDIIDGFDNGPWYMDGVNGILHIHNRKTAVPYFNYRYQDENGEVLKVQIVTNWTTGSSSGTISSAITPNKGLEVTRYDSPHTDGNIPLSLLPKRGFDTVLDMDSTRNGIDTPTYKVTDPDGKVTYGSYQYAAECQSRGCTIELQQGLSRTIDEEIVNTRIQYFEGKKIAEQERLYNEALLNDYKVVRPAEDKYNMKAWETATDKLAADLDKHYKELETAGFKGYDSWETAEYEVKPLFNKVVEEGTPLSNFNTRERELLSKRVIADNPDYTNPYLETRGKVTVRSEGVKVTPGTTTRHTGGRFGSMGQTTNVPMRSGVIENINNEEDVKKALMQAGLYMVDLRGNYKYPNTDLIKDYQQLVKDAKAKDPNGVVGSAKLRWDRDGNAYFEIDYAGVTGVSMTMYDLALHKHNRNKPGSGGSKKAIKAYINYMRNRAAKAKHKEIEVQMIVIGRPALAAGQYLNIWNIGKKYSGKWYIKTCIHQLDSNGYTCSLTLQKKAEPNGIASGVSTKKEGGFDKFIDLSKLVAGGEGKIHPTDYAAIQDMLNRSEISKANDAIRKVRLANELGYEENLFQDINLYRDIPTYTSGKGLDDNGVYVNPDYRTTKYYQELNEIDNQRLKMMEDLNEMRRRSLQIEENKKRLNFSR